MRLVHKSIVYLILSLVASVATGQSYPQIQSARLFLENGQLEKALASLKPHLENSSSESTQALAQVMAGQVYLRMANYELARQHLEKALTLQSNVSAYAFYLLGQSYAGLKRYKDARVALDRVGYFKPPSELKYQVRYLLSEIALNEKNFDEAYRHLKYLDRKWRRSAHYPEVLWRSLLVAQKRNSQGEVCRVARKLYAQFPTHPLVYDWTMDLQNVRVEGQRLGCMAMKQDAATRVRRLQLAGQVSRARSEIEIIRGNGQGESAERADMMLAQFLTNDGYPDEALKILVKYYGSHLRDSAFLLTLARAAARGGEFQTAVGLYQQVHSLVPHQRVGREALFQAAFLSYQFQDYDGAMRRFESFIRQYGRSGLSKDARWNIAWIQYLRGDYEGALLSLQELKPQPRRGRSAPRDDRITYWTAMSLAKLGRQEEARKVFESLAKPDPTAYYALAGKARLERMPKPETTVPVVERQVASQSITSQGVIVNGESNEVPSEGESEEALAISQEEAANETESAVDLGEDTVVDSDDDEKVVVTDFRDPKLRRRFESAQELFAMGFYEWARHELYEVERRSRNPQYLKNLIKSYEDMQSYHRAVSIADTFFVSERIQNGISGARPLWETAYPKAYRPLVERYAGQFSISQEMVWSIMRAESHFKPDVMSPVGAKGLLQLMPETARQVSRILGDEEEFQVMSLINPEVNIRLGTRYMLRLSQRFKNSLPLVAGAYNAGPHRVESWLANFGHLDMDEFIEHIPFLETRNYAKKVTRNFAVYRQVYQRDTAPVRWLAEAVPVKLSGRPSPRENWDP